VPINPLQAPSFPSTRLRSGLLSPPFHQFCVTQNSQREDSDDIGLEEAASADKPKPREQEPDPVGFRTTLAGMLVQLQDAYGMSEAIDLRQASSAPSGSRLSAMVELW
jgi:hypothetical protein